MIAGARSHFSIALAVGTALLPAATAAKSNAIRPWTLEDILLVPEILEISLSGDARTVLYAVRASDVNAGRPRITLRLVDIEKKTQRDVIEIEAAKLIRQIPGTDDWSALLDIGQGLQLYRIDRHGKVDAIVLNPAPVRVGKADMSLSIGGDSPPHSVGVLAYDWSPDGRWLWYSLLTAENDPVGVRFDKEVTALRDRRRSQIEARIEFFLRGPDGRVDKVTSRPSSDRMALHAGGNIIWQEDQVGFRVEESDGSVGSVQAIWAWDRVQKSTQRLESERDTQSLWMIAGPRGGKLESTTGDGSNELAEILPGGRRHIYGRFDFTIGDPRSAGFSRSADRQRTIVGTRYLSTPRYGLALIDGNSVREISTKGSLTKCGFSGNLSFAVCVYEGMTLAPELVQVDLSTGKLEHLLEVSPRHSAITPLAVRPRTWVNRLGYRATGYVILPRGYRKDRRYPTIVVTHGSDADERFAESSNQWNYPVQLLAERGYAILLINDPAPQQSAALQAAYRAWLRGSGPPGPEEIQKLVWINGVYSFEDAVTELAAEGLVDLDRVGIAGYSRGAQMVNVAVTHSRMFRAASSGDGGFLEPAGYSLSPASYTAIYGGSPFGEHAANYRRFSPSLNADKICAPLLQQVASASRSQADLHDALRGANVPAQISLYPGASAASDETHLFHIPSNRLLAMRENVAWFDYWLLGRRDSDAPFPRRFAEWDRMAVNAGGRCGVSRH
ncbi:prolyl oligopeptidase family serine peptidase [Sphingopyxis sp.]|uniref:prolyl oligopeptidase family serine peptidase n=1 Tax=Sphingopyxis sp. TaxID=1908224 RepID=UPI002D78DB75|nr:prolyl oligopeptidase family serine peptidase [Sphingopyxis sp.]HET6523517.1 prolyl oligopeptidase family serine peptidase [Sphingopyxis sp.]